MSLTFSTLFLCVLIIFSNTITAYSDDRSIEITNKIVSSDRRVALVIGNGRYIDKSLVLRNPGNDATSIAEVLTETGFEVILRKDAGRREIFSAVKEFGRQLKKSDIGLFFYAGHGVQIDSANYIIPVDILGNELVDVDDLRRDAISLAEIIEKMKDAGTRNIIVLDACRDNPFMANISRSSARGLARLVTPAETAILYATDPGNTASDGTSGINGIFTRRLVEMIRKDGMELVDVMREVSRLVTKDTKNAQRPIFDGVFTNKFFFRPAKHNSDNPFPSGDAEKEAWDIVRYSLDAAEIKDFIEKFPKGNYSNTAKLKLNQLEKQTLQERERMVREKLDREKDDSVEARKRREKDMEKYHIPIPSF